MIKAAIDIGTNSTRLFIAEVEDNRITKSISRTTKITRLGEKVNATKMLKTAAVNRTVKVLKEYRDTIDSSHIDQIKAVATSAVRDAKNAEKFLSKVAAECGLTVEVLDGLQEARLSFLGATADARFREEEKTFLVIDIGGGSTELIFGEGEKIFDSASLDAGCVRLTEMFLKSDPPTAAQIKELRTYLRHQLEDRFSAGAYKDIKKRDLEAIAVAGTSTSLVAIDLGLEPYDPDIIHGAPFSRERTEFILLKVAKLSLMKLMHLKGLQPERADVIVAGAAIQAEIMDYFGLDKVRVSEKDILDGIILDDKAKRLSH